ncbi:biotin/acetyl-CoA-carboxylase ligase [Methanocaldococcus infernus ME]|uniref:Biotin/acetyl-CoA-carboxylase ligase n=1 Tax=Methanocaldococcus infernus (strain DSM 11812 / JCM 15783 / ME) TaxID=573063 RepID=D5VUB6_METIM|nr:biotin--[acetyl-CoA-carboxylase] ligase [Methanocaldococcus infernus]ADG12728.1 biotin/acetyl-CoA-carboxylase ligase [Methanocaldococcus infernus ME]
MKIIKLKEVDSTNEYAKKLIDEGESNFLVIADKQYRGKGRLGRTWLSKPGGLYFSIVLENKFSYIFPILIPILIIKAIDVDAKIKFPNDIVYKGKKLSGILIEHYKDKIIVGIGINVENDLEGLDVAISLKEIKGEVKKEEIFNNFLNLFLEYYKKLLSGEIREEEILKEYKKLSETIGRYVKLTLPNEEVRGTVFDIDFEGISLATEEGIRKFPIGDVKNLR